MKTIDNKNIKNVSHLIGFALVVYVTVSKASATLLQRVMTQHLPLEDCVVALSEVFIYTLGMLCAIACVTDNKDDWQLRPPKLVDLGVSAMHFAGIFYPVLVVNLVMSKALDAVHVQSYNARVALPDDMPTMIITVLEYVILPPLLEEALFRGAILSKLRRFGDGFAIVVSALLFTVLHPTLYSYPGIFILAALFAYSDIKCGSILPSVIMHMLNNAISLFSSAVEDTNVLATINMVIFYVSLLCLGYSLARWFIARRSGRKGISLSGPYWKFLATVPVLAYLAFCVWNVWRITIFA